MKMFVLVSIGTVLAVIAGCQKQGTAAAPAVDPLPAHLIATAEPAGALNVAAAKTQAKDGDAIVVRGRIGGQKEPLAANRAVMSVEDLSLPTCDKSPMKACETPWDSCCETRETVAAKSATVQVLGSDGKPLKTGLKGAGGIAPGKNVVIAGTARIPSGSSSLIIEATQIYIAP